MKKEEHENLNDEDQKDHNPETEEQREKIEEKIDEELDESFPASDPPSYSQPGNDDIKHYH